MLLFSHAALLRRSFSPFLHMIKGATLLKKKEFPLDWHLMDVRGGSEVKGGDVEERRRGGSFMKD